MHKWDQSCKWKNWRNEQQCEWKLTLQLWWWLRSYIWKSESWMYAEWYLEWRTASLCGYLLTVNQLLFVCEVCKVRDLFSVVNIPHIVTIYNSSEHVLLSWITRKSLFTVLLPVILTNLLSSHLNCLISFLEFIKIW